MNVVIVDDHGVLRDGLRQLLERHADIQVVASEKDARSGVEAVLRLRPDVVTMDISMPGSSGIDATRAIVEGAPKTAVLMLSVYASPDTVVEAFHAGARGYVLKSALGDEVVDAVRATAAGRRYMGSGVGDALPEWLHGAGGATVLGTLTAREREILKLVVEGKSNAEAAQVLNLSPRTVETYRGRLMEKLFIEDLPALVKFAIRHGITPVE